MPLGCEVCGLWIFFGVMCGRGWWRPKEGREGGRND